MLGELEFAVQLQLKKQRCCYCKVHRRSGTLSLLSEAPALKRKRVGDGKMGIRHKCYHERNTKKVPYNFIWGEGRGQEKDKKRENIWLGKVT